MAIVFDANGNLVDTENNINFFNTGTEQVFPNQDISTYFPEKNNTFLQPDRTGIDTLRFVDNNSTSLQPNYLLPNTNKMPQFTGANSAGAFTVPDNDLEENAVTVDELGNLKQPGGIKDLFKALIGFAVPGASFFLNQGRGALDGIKSLNQRLRNTDFGRSRTLSDYFDAKSYGGIDARDRAAEKTMREARAIQKQVDMRPSSIQTNQDRGRGNRDGGANYSAPSRPSRASSYRDSSSFGRIFHG